MGQKGVIQNPVIRGFNPDPSIVRVDEDYYLATSTFEWFPGVQIHHSRDLINWTLIDRPLTRPSQLDLLGVPDSCGVWAPCLSYNDGTFYLVYSNVKSFSGEWKDTPNFLVTAPDIYGPWSEPTFLNSSGFDASLFHDLDGRSYLVNMLMDHRDNRLFGGIIIQEYDKQSKRLIGDVNYLFEGTSRGCTEGPHLYQRNGYYYLLLAEGGTGYNHCITMLRSRSLMGPYEIHPENPIITAQHKPDNYLQKTGHGDLVETQNGEWFTVFLTGRPLTQRGRCTIGRETAIAPIIWKDDNWPYHANDSKSPDQFTSGPDFASHVVASTDNSRVISFSPDSPLDINLQSLRTPVTKDWVDLISRPGYLRMTGRESLSSCHKQSLLGHRLQAHHVSVTTCIEFEPDTFQQMAGLVCYYNTGHYHYLHLRGGDVGNASGETYLAITTSDNFDTSEQIVEPIITPNNRLFMKVEFTFDRIQFYYALEEHNWCRFGPELDGSILSDDYVAHEEEKFQPCFTGAFIAMCCQDLSGQHITADFNCFNYHEIASV